ncbi:MAG: hypothetical protein ACO3A2_02440 [Bdellovibrionia bacterium]
MDWSHCFFLLRASFSAPKRVFSLFKGAQAKWSSIRSHAQALGLLFFSAFIGFWAHQFSKQEALGQWEKAFPPSVRIMDAAMKSRSWSRLTDPKRYQKIIRGLPVTLDQLGSFWMTTQGDWVAVFLTAQDEADFSTFIYHGKSSSNSGTPENWIRIGMGWKAMDDVLLRMDEQMKTQQVLKPKPSRQPVFDSREIIY